MTQQTGTISGTLQATIDGTPHTITLSGSIAPSGLTPPAAVDCVLSAWGPWVPDGAWSTCANNSQSRTETRSRTVTTAPANGGVACGPLAEQRTVTQACTVTPPNPGGNLVANWVAQMRRPVDGPGNRTAGYSTQRLMPNGKMFNFGGYSHDSLATNSVCERNAAANTVTVTVPHKAYPPSVPKQLTNRDNHYVIPYPDGTVLVSRGQPAAPVGKEWGVYKDGDWADIGGADGVPPGGTGDALRFVQNPAVAVIGNDGWVFGGDGGNPIDWLFRITHTPGAGFISKVWANNWGDPSFTGAERLRYVSNSGFAYNGAMYVYAGGLQPRTGPYQNGKTLYKIDVSGTAPVMSVVSVNTLPDGQRVEGEASVAVVDAANHRMICVSRSGDLVNVYDFVSSAWSLVDNTGRPSIPGNYPAGDFVPGVGTVMEFSDGSCWKFEVSL